MRKVNHGHVNKKNFPEKAHSKTFECVIIYSCDELFYTKYQYFVVTNMQAIEGYFEG